MACKLLRTFEHFSFFAAETRSDGRLDARGTLAFVTKLGALVTAAVQSFETGLATR